VKYGGYCYHILVLIGEGFVKPSMSELNTMKVLLPSKTEASSSKNIQK